VASVLQAARSAIRKVSSSPSLATLSMSISSDGPALESMLDGSSAASASLFATRTDALADIMDGCDRPPTASMDGLKGRALAKARSLRASEQSRQAYLSSLTSISSLSPPGGGVSPLHTRASLNPNPTLYGSHGVVSVGPGMVECLQLPRRYLCEVLLQFPAALLALDKYVREYRLSVQSVRALWDDSGLRREPHCLASLYVHTVVARADGIFSAMREPATQSQSARAGGGSARSSASGASVGGGGGGSGSGRNSLTGSPLSRVLPLPQSMLEGRSALLEPSVTAILSESSSLSEWSAGGRLGAGGGGRRLGAVEVSPPKPPPSRGLPTADGSGTARAWIATARRYEQRHPSVRDVRMRSLSPAQRSSVTWPAAPSPV
jgi:hypothetical protein